MSLTLPERLGALKPQKVHAYVDHLRFWLRKLN
jgi:hypothetical protein